MALGEKNITAAIKAFSFSAKTRGPGTSFPLTSGGVFSSEWIDASDFAKVVGTCYVSGGSYATSSLHGVTITSMSLGDSFYITGSDSTIYTFSASGNITSSTSMTITSCSIGDQFYITGSTSIIYTYSASWGATASLVQGITACNSDDKFAITGSDSLIYIYSSSWNSTASLAIAITTSSNADKFYITASDGTTKYTYSASIAPVPADNWVSKIFYFPTGSSLANSVINLKDEINNSSISSSVTASLDSATLLLWAKDASSTGNLIVFQSGSTQVSFTGGRTIPSDDWSNRIFYFSTGSSLANSVINLKDEINNSSISSSITASLNSATLLLWTKANSANNISFQSGSTQSSFARGGVVPSDANNVFYFPMGLDFLLNTTVNNLKNEINNSSVNGFLTSSATTNILYLYAILSGSEYNGVMFQSGSTQVDLSNGSSLPPDIPNRIYYFPLGTVLSGSCVYLRQEINNSVVGTFMTVTNDTNVFDFYAIPSSSAGDGIGFQSGSTQFLLSRAAPGGLGSNGTLWIQQSPVTTSADYTGSATAVYDGTGISFTQDLYTTYVRLRYAQTGSTGQYVFRLVSYFTP